MKPLKLDMTAFGPFHETASIDFTKLGDNPFFIIAGPTGAGKTTILDGICFALYGTSSGVDRKDSDFRSHSADRARETKVSFGFEVAGKRYLVERWPTQEVPRKRGNAGLTTTKLHAVEFAEIDRGGRPVEGTALSEVKAVASRIEFILGLTPTQFRQVVLLPQGEFRTFLLAGTKERTEILKKLFRSDRFEAIEGRLKARKAGCEKELERIRSENQGRLESAGAEGIEGLEHAIAASESRLVGLRGAEGAAALALSRADAGLEAGRRIEALHVRLENATREWETVEALRSANEEKRARLDRAAKASLLEPAAKRVDELVVETAQRSREVAQRDAESDRCKLALAAAEAALAGAAARRESEEPPLRHEKQALESALPKFAERDAAAVEAGKATEEAMLWQAAVDRLKERVDVAEGRLKALNLQIPAVTKAVAGREALRQRLDLARQRREEVAALVAVESTRPGALASAAAATEAFEAAKAGCDRAKGDAEALQAKAIRAQAIVLANSLKEGEACPVCGSTRHPAKASGRAGEIPDEAALQATRDAVAEAEGKREVARGALDAAVMRLTTIDARIAQARETLDKRGAGEAGTAGDPAALALQLSELEAKAEALAALESEKAGLEPALAADKASLEEARSNHASATVRLKALEGRLSELGRHLPPGVPDAAAAAARIDEAARLLQALDSGLEASRKAVEAAGSARVASQTKRDEAAKERLAAESRLALARRQLSDALLDEGFVDEAGFRESLLGKDEIERLKGEMRAFDDRRAAAKAAAVEAGDACAGSTRPDLAVLGSARDAAASARDAALSDRTAEETRKGALEETMRQVGEALAEQEALEAKLSVVGRLSNLAAGENAKRIGLHTYYLAALFDEVARSASHRLDRMSRGRYRLRRTDEVGDARTRAGLDLVASDSWSGAERPVRTLSGGESFLASLSLALGLSDAVLAQSGGRSLDALFVDEGFGSLDSDSLDMALRTLQELQGNGSATGRAVGIISHIDEVKKAVGKRIEVARKPGEAVSSISLWEGNVML